MAKRKYNYFILVTEFDEAQYESYQEAMHEYGKADSATLYGSDEEGDVSVIFSK